MGVIGVSNEKTKLLSKDKKEELTGVEKIPYPKSIIFIVGNEFCERFTFYGLRTILTIYLTQELLYSPDTGTIIFHLFAMLAYFTPVFGAIIADSWLGKFKTILFISIIYAIGSVIVSVGAIPTDLTMMKTISLIGLFIIAVGTGGIKPCVSAFGGDQFKPGQERQLQRFFSFFYISINLGSVFATVLTPIFREDVHCFDQNSCYSLAFGVPALLMIVALLLFICGKPLYTINPPEGNIVVKVSKCIFHAIRNKMKRSKDEKKKDHWLDYADDKFERTLINEVKAVLRVLVLYIPLPVFWALFDQQGSRWTLQATRMDGVIGNFHIKPDQMMVLNPLLIIMFIPLFDLVIYPLLKKCNLLDKPLQRIAVGGFVTALSFGIAGFIELKLEAGLPNLPVSGESEITVINNSPCPLTVAGSESFSLEKFESNYLTGIPLGKEHSWTITSTCEYTAAEATASFTSASPMQSMMVTLSDGKLQYLQANETKEKAKGGEAQVRIFYSTDQSSGNISFFIRGEKEEKILYPDSLTSLYGVTDYCLLTPGKYKIFPSTATNYSSTAIGEKEFFSGATYIVYIYQNSNQNEVNFHVETLVEPNIVHLLLQIPQYVTITAGEIMFSITGLEFSYSQSPTSMKSVLQASWLLTVAFGNLLVLIIAKLNMFTKNSHELFFFGSLMALDMVVFAIMAYRYKYVKIEDSREEQTPSQGTKDANEEETDFNK